MQFFVQASITRAATLTSIGNFSSRIVGLLRETVKSFYFGNGQAASAFELASNLPTQVFDLLIGGMMSSALVPTFSALASDDERRDEFGKLLGAIISISLLALCALVALLWIFAFPIALFRGGANQDPFQLSSLLRITIPAIVFMNLSGILTAALQARGRFGFTAFTATTFNLVMIVCVVLLESQLGVVSLAVGLLLGSIAQVLIQLPGLRGVPIRLSLDWRHPGLSHILKLFLPVAGGLALALLANEASFIFASAISPEGPATMRYAAQVIQFPLGMVVTAISTAILPALSSTQGEDFKSTLASGLRLVLTLILPASVGLFILASPVITLLFQHGEFNAQSTNDTAIALRAAVPGLLFAAIDTPLIFAFYAQRDTRTPTLIGLISTLFYMVIVSVQVALARANVYAFTLDHLILSNALKTGVDAALMGALLSRKIGGLRGYGVGQLAMKVALSTFVMGATVWLLMIAFTSFASLDTKPGALFAVVFSASAGAVVYLACVNTLRIQELQFLKSFLKRFVK